MLQEQIGTTTPYIESDPSLPLCILLLVVVHPLLSTVELLPNKGAFAARAAAIHVAPAS